MKIVRIANRKDLQEMTDLWEELMQMHSPLHGAFRLSAQARRVARYELDARLRHPYSRFFICQVDGKTAGMIAIQYSETSPSHQNFRRGYIAETIVRKAFRGQGVGKRLVEAARSWLAGLGVDYIELQVAPGNEQAVRFWKNQGFRVLTYHMAKEIDPEKPMK